MAGNPFDDFINIAPSFCAIISFIAASLSIYFYPKLTIPAIILNFIVGVWFLVKGYSGPDNNDGILSDYYYYKFWGWILLLSSFVLGLKIIFIGNKLIPQMSSLLLGKKNLKNNYNTV